jgi:hypothetical protein
MRLIARVPLIIVSIISCDRPTCTNTNRVFDQNPPASKEYKRELARSINTAGHNNVRYWIDEYMEKEGKTLMTIYIQGHGLCAKGILDITNSNGNSRLQHYKEVKGGSYSGAELSGLTYDIDSSHGDYNFIFRDVQRIID